MQPIIAIQNLLLRVGQAPPLLEVEFTVSKPGVIGIVGPGGSGKSLLLEALARRNVRGLQMSGTIETTPDAPAPEPPVRAKDSPPRGTILRALTHPFAHGPDSERRLQESLSALDLWDVYQSRLSESTRSLSRLERLKLLACRSAVKGAPYLLLDDPTVGLDPEEARQFDAVVAKIAQRIPVLWASRALRRPAATAVRILVLKEGKLVADGPANQLVVSPPPAAVETIEAAAGHGLNPGLEEIYHELLAMGSRAERAVHRAVQSLTDQNLSIAREVLETDIDIDQRERAIKEAALGLVGRAAPVGRELRTLSTVMQAATDLERIADHAVNIAEVTLAIGDEPLIKPLIDIPRMAEKAQAMVRQSLDALVRRDASLAYGVYEQDIPVDALYRELFEELLGFVTDGGDAYRAGQALYLLFVARYLERVADHATNIAEHVIFMVEGKRSPRTSGRNEDQLPRPFLPR